MPVSRSGKGNEEEQVHNRISRFGFSQRSVPDTGAKMVSSKSPVPRLHFRWGLPRSPTESCGHGICQYFRPPQLSTPLRPSRPTCLLCGWHIWPLCFESRSVISATVSLPPGLTTSSHTAQCLMARLSLTLPWRKRN